jgi:hypothetical protein
MLHDSFQRLTTPAPCWPSAPYCAPLLWSIRQGTVRHPGASARGVGGHHAVSQKPPLGTVRASRFFCCSCYPARLATFRRATMAPKLRGASSSAAPGGTSTSSDVPSDNELTMSVRHTIMARLDSLEHPQHQEPPRRLPTPDVHLPFH